MATHISFVFYQIGDSHVVLRTGCQEQPYCLRRERSADLPSAATCSSNIYSALSVERAVNGLLFASCHGNWSRIAARIDNILLCQERKVFSSTSFGYKIGNSKSLLVEKYPTKIPSSDLPANFARKWSMYFMMVTEYPVKNIASQYLLASVPKESVRSTSVGDVDIRSISLKASLSSIQCERRCAEPIPVLSGSRHHHFISLGVRCSNGDLVLLMQIATHARSPCTLPVDLTEVCLSIISLRSGLYFIGAGYLAMNIELELGFELGRGERSVGNRRVERRDRVARPQALCRTRDVAVKRGCVVTDRYHIDEDRDRDVSTGGADPMLMVPVEDNKIDLLTARFMMMLMVVHALNNDLKSGKHIIKYYFISTVGCFQRRIANLQVDDDAE
ncbi:hypothetical protein Tco_0093091 [Tanacetum coccineum]